MTTQPLIDRDSPNPPSANQFVHWQREFRRQFREAAKARGLEGEITAVIGVVYGDSNDIPLNTGLPRKDQNNALHRGTINRGEVLPDPRGGGQWHVLGNDLVELWPGKQETDFDGMALCANVIRLIRTDPTISSSALPVEPEGFTTEPYDFEELLVDPEAVTNEQQRGVIKYLIALASVWGYWSPIPWTEFLAGLETEDVSGATEAIYALEAQGFIALIHPHDTEAQIHFKPPIATVFLPRAA